MIFFVLLRLARQQERQTFKGFTKQPNDSARDHAFRSIYFAFPAQLRREITKRQGHQFYCIVLSWDAVLPLQLQLNFPSERVGIMAKEFERKRSQGFNDVFTASPLSDRKVPILDVRLIEVCFITELTVLYGFYTCNSKL